MTAVGVCAWCEEPVTLRLSGPSRGAACPCGMTRIPARFLDLAAIPRAESTAASIDRLAGRWHAEPRPDA